MSTQETNLKAIADAIREKEGTIDPIPASSFPERIRAIQTGGSLPENMHTIAVTADPPEGGTVSGGGVAQVGMTVTVSAEATDGYKINTWTSNGAEVGTDKSYTFTVTGDVEVVAVFEVASRLPDGYTEVEYIESGSGQYIDIGKFDTDNRIVVDAYLSDFSGSFLLGCGRQLSASGKNYSWFGCDVNKSSVIFYFYSNSSMIVSNDTVPKRVVLDVDSYENLINYDGNSFNGNPNSGLKISCEHLILFAWGEVNYSGELYKVSNPCVCKLYSCFSFAPSVHTADCWCY